MGADDDDDNNNNNNIHTIYGDCAAAAAAAAAAVRCCVYNNIIILYYSVSPLTPSSTNGSQRLQKYQYKPSIIVVVVRYSIIYICTLFVHYSM